MRVFRSALVPVCAALCAAIAAQLAIDVVGDYLLPHDAYDDVAHGSRYGAALIALALSAAVMLRALGAALREARGSDDAFCASVATLLPRDRRTFAAVVAVVSLVFVAALELCDSALAGKAAGNAPELLGGSIALGISLTVCSSFVVCAITWRAVTCLTRKRRAFIALAYVFLGRRSSRLAGPLLPRRFRRIAGRTVAYGPHRANRAPPSPCFAAATTL